VTIFQMPGVSKGDQLRTWWWTLQCQKLHCARRPTFIRFDTIPACDGQNSCN